MSLVSTEAIILQTFPYSETSKIARLATREFGVLSVVAKGARRSKSKFGANLQLMSGGSAQLYFRQTRDLHTLAEFDVETQRLGLARDIERYAAATALAELVIRFSPQQSGPEIYELTRQSLDVLQDADPEQVSTVSLMVMWSGVAGLGFAPTLGACAVDGASLTAEDRDFSVPEGGFVCRSCARSRETSRLPVHDCQALSAFVSGQLPTVSLTAKHLTAHRRLCARFIQRHVSEGRELKGLDFWEEGNGRAR